MVPMISSNMYHDIPHGTQITKDDIPYHTEHPHSTHDIPHICYDIPHSTEHSYGTQDIPHDTDPPPNGTKHPHGTEHILYTVKTT